MERDAVNVSGSSGDGERRLVEAALAQFERLTTAAVRAVPPSADSHRESSAAGSFTIPGYRILREIHRGGQGVVYQAIQESTQRKMAVKVLKEGPFADRIELARFDREVDVLSRLNHPHIVTIHDRGLTAGHAYYVMDYVAGRPLDAYVAGAELSIEETLGLFVKVCEAVNVAHLRGVIHRDLKPGNILVVDDVGPASRTSVRDDAIMVRNADPTAEPRILDFGLARLAEDASSFRTESTRLGGHSALRTLTVTGQFVGSLPWASPEQAAGQSDLIDIRTDVYSLGVILYQILTGRFPYPVSGPMGDVVRHIALTSPARPSTVGRKLDHDLELILLKCLAKEPERRYQSAGELARDVRNYLTHEPVSATSPSAAYRLRKFVRRNRGAVIAGAVVALTLVIAAGVSIAFGLSEARQRRAAESARTRAETAEAETKARADELEQVAQFQEAQLSGIDVQTMGVRIRTGLLDKARSAAERSKLQPEEMDARVGELEKLIAGSDFTGIALEALRDNFFQPALAAIHEQFADQPLIKARLLQTLASTLQELGLLDAASGPQMEALAIHRRELGDEHLDTLTSISALGVLLRHQGKPADAEPYAREALEKRRRVLGDEHPDTLNSIGNMGDLLRSEGKLADAEPYVREALEKRRRVLGDEHPDTLNSINSMGFLLRSQGRLAEAEPYFREALEKNRRVLGDEHRHTMATISNLGLVLQEQSKLSEAEPYFREALDMSRRVLGDEHPDTLISIDSMGGLLWSEGKAAEAEPYIREALQKNRRVLGEEHPNTLNSINNLGGLFSSQGKLDEAEPYYRQALEKRRRVLGDDHPNTLTSISNLGVLLKDQGKLDEAEPYYREALEKCRRLGDEHPDALRSINNMGALLRAQGKLAEAEPYFREATEKLRRTLGDEHANTVMAILNLGGLLQAQGQSTEAIALLAPAEPAARRAFTGSNAVRLGRFLTALGRARAATGDFETAEAGLKEAHATLADALRATGPDRRAVLAGLVELYEAWHAAEPDQGHDAAAAEWRAKLGEFESSTPQPNP